MSSLLRFGQCMAWFARRHCVGWKHCRGFPWFPISLKLSSKWFRRLFPWLLFRYFSRIHMKKRSFTGPWTLLTGGSNLGEGAATMDQTYVPAGMTIPAWRTMMGTSVDGRFIVKRKQETRLPYGIFPYAFALLLNAFAGRLLRTWMLAKGFQ